MSELRQDAVTGVWTIVVPERAGRPKDFARKPDEIADATGCPFCAGREDQTPPTRWEAALPGECSWTVRVMENKYPALEAPDDSDGAEELDAPGPYHGMTGFGQHEIVVETPRHSEGLADYSPDHLALLADAFAARLAHWRHDVRLAAPVLFRNWGRAAGASLSHAHTQLVVLPRVPDALVRELGNFTQAASGSRRCPLCEAIELDDDAGRTIWSDDAFALQSPWAAPIPYFMRIAPRACSLSLADATGPERASFGAALGAAASALRGAFGDVAFNVVVHVAPYTVHRMTGLPYHWHAEIIPRTSDQAGLEWGSGTYINVIDPDDAARVLCDAIGRG